MKRRNFLACSLLFAASCSASNLGSAKDQNYSDTRPEKLRLAITDVKGLEPLEEDYGPFRQVLEEILELPVEFFPVENYVAAAPMLLSGQVDLVFAGPSEYLILRARAGAEPIIAVTRPDYYSIMAVKGDSSIQSLADLKGKTIAMRTQGSTAGHIGATKLLLDSGLKTEDFQVKMLEDRGLESLLSGTIDVWADSNSRYASFVAAAGAESEVRIIAQGEKLPNDVFVARNTLDPEFVEELKGRMLAAQVKLLEAMASTPANGKYQQSAFIVAVDEQYDELREVYKAIGQASVIR